MPPEAGAHDVGGGSSSSSSSSGSSVPDATASGAAELKHPMFGVQPESVIIAAMMVTDTTVHVNDTIHPKVSHENIAPDAKMVAPKACTANDTFANARQSETPTAPTSKAAFQLATTNETANNPHVTS